MGGWNSGGRFCALARASWGESHRRFGDIMDCPHDYPIILGGGSHRAFGALTALPQATAEAIDAQVSCIADGLAERSIAADVTGIASVLGDLLEYPDRAELEGRMEEIRASTDELQPAARQLALESGTTLI